MKKWKSLGPAGGPNEERTGAKSMAFEREADCVQLTEERDGLLRKIDDLKASAIN